MRDISKNIEALKDGLRRLRAAVMKPPKVMNVAEWADEYRRLSSSSSTGGKFRTSSVEVARGPLNAIHEEGVGKITLMTATQLMKTTFLENVCGYYMHLDPSPIMIVQPKEDMAEAFVKEKLAPMIASTPALVRAFGGRLSLKTRSSDNTLKMKRFRGGFLAITSAGSPANLAMRAIRILLMDEVDKYPETKEGNAIAIAGERTETFSHNSKIIQVCSPTVTNKSEIAKGYSKSDERRAYVACPHCGHEDHLKWKNVKWHKAEGGEPQPDSAAYVCEECGVLWDEKDRVRLLTTKNAIKWRQTKVFECCGVRQDPQETRLWKWHGNVDRAVCSECGEMAVSNHHAGFHASFLYSPWKHLREDVKKFLEAKGDKPSLRTFVNTRLAETFEDDKELESVEMDSDILFSRREPAWSYVPDGVLVVTGGIDVHGDRLEAAFVGWGHGEESWSLGYHVIEGDPSGDEPWLKLDELLLSPLEKADGTRMYVAGCCIDSGGHHTQQVYSFCGPRARRLVVPIKGGSEASGVRSPIFPTSKAIPIGKPYIIGTNAAKDRIESMMNIATPGPGYMHVPANEMHPTSWFKGMTSEKRVVFYDKNQRRTRWEPIYKGIRNEALDTRVYAYTALIMLMKFLIVKPRTLMPTGSAPRPADALPLATSRPAMTQGKANQDKAQLGKRPRRPSPFGNGGFPGRGRRPPGL